jgi:hypothetical protein
MLKHNRPAPREANQSDFDFGPSVQANPTANEKRPRPDRKNPLKAGPLECWIHLSAIRRELFHSHLL